MQIDHLEHRQKEGKKSSRKLAPPRIRERVCRLLGVGSNMYNKIIHAYFGAASEAAAAPAFYTVDTRKGNRERKATRILTTAKVYIATRDFIRAKRMNRERVAARQVMDMLM